MYLHEIDCASGPLNLTEAIQEFYRNECLWQPTLLRNAFFCVDEDKGLGGTDKDQRYVEPSPDEVYFNAHL